MGSLIVVTNCSNEKTDIILASFKTLNLLRNGTRLSKKSVPNGNSESEILLNSSLAYLAFIIDSQHAMIFGHSLILHAQELNLKPPCNEDVWAAGSAFEWHRLTQRDTLEENVSEPRFIEILKMFMNEPSNAAKERLPIDSFACFIVLHGLISIKWHLEQKATGTGNYFAKICPLIAQASRRVTQAGRLHQHPLPLETKNRSETIGKVAWNERYIRGENISTEILPRLLLRQCSLDPRCCCIESPISLSTQASSIFKSLRA